MIFFLLKPCLWYKTPLAKCLQIASLPTLIITVVMNISWYIFPSYVIYLGGWIKNIYLEFIPKTILNVAPASLLARQLTSANNIYLFSVWLSITVWLWINNHLSTLLVELNNIKMYTDDKQNKNKSHIGLNVYILIKLLTLQQRQIWTCMSYFI